MKQLLLLFMLTLPLSAPAQPTMAAPGDEAAVRALVTDFGNAFNAHDTKAFAATFADDADFTNWLGMSAHGRAKIEAFHVPVLTVMYKNGVQKIVDTRVRFIRPDVAAVDVQSEVTGGMTPDGKPSSLLKFLLNWTVTKEADGHWLIKVMHNARLPEMNPTLPDQKP